MEPKTTALPLEAEHREILKQGWGLDGKQFRTLELLDLVYEGQLNRLHLIRAIADAPIPHKARDKWHCDGLRKTLNGSLSTAKKNDQEMASAISRRISRFTVQRGEEFISLSADDRQILEDIHMATGAKAWEDEETLNDRLLKNSEFIAELGMNFGKTPPAQLAQKLTGKEHVDFLWSNCGHSDSRRATQINTALNKGQRMQCPTCRKLDSSLTSWYEENRPFLEASKVDISALSVDDLLDSAYSKRTFEIGYGCGHRERTTFQSLKAKHKRALDMGQEFIACNGCKITDGTYEVGFRMALQLATRLAPGCVLDWQVELPNLPGMNYDLTIIAPNGKVYFIEIDGGYHYKGHSSAAKEDFERKVEVDRLKTEEVLKLGHGLIRIDERNHRGVLTEEMLDVLVAATQGTLGSYTVIGEECPGAKKARKNF